MTQTFPLYIVYVNAKAVKTFTTLATLQPHQIDRLRAEFAPYYRSAPENINVVKAA